MIFNNNDLDRVYIEIHGAYPPEIGSDRLAALVNRLETAERVVLYTEKYAPKVDELQALVKDWHKACGRK